MPAIKIITSLLFISSIASAASFDIPMQGTDKIILNGMNMDVTFTAQTGDKLRITGVEKAGSEGAYVIERRNGIVTIAMKEFEGKQAWLGALKTKVVPTAKITIAGPSVPVELFANHASVITKGWKQSLSLNLTNGKVTTDSSEGEMAIYLQKGDVSVSNHKGALIYDVYSGKGIIKTVNGRMQISHFAGDLSIDRVKGSVVLMSGTTNVQVLQGNGNINFSAQKGAVVFKGFQGRMEGKTLESLVTADLSLDSELDIRTKTGNVNVNTPKASAYDVNLLTSAGDIRVPQGLRVLKMSSEKSVNGKVGSDASRGSIFVRSQEGSISVK